MKLHFASMALSLAIFTRHVRTTAAFTMRPLSTVNSVSTQSAAGKFVENRRRGVIAIPYQEFSKLSATVEDETTTLVNGEEDLVKFPLKGKNVEECAPRMRFAPSPTGR